VEALRRGRGFGGHVRPGHSTRAMEAGSGPVGTSRTGGKCSERRTRGIGKKKNWLGQRGGWSSSE